ncbi:MAG: hypothetical protein WA160_02820 [Pseudobdellovibrio sp.]
MKNLSSFFLAVITTFIMSAYANADQLKLEPLFGFMQNKDGLVFQVYSGGCTDKNNFEIRSENKNGILAVGLYRIAADFCKAYFPYGVLLQYSYQELGIRRGERFDLTNVITPPRRGLFRSDND